MYTAKTPAFSVPAETTCIELCWVTVLVGSKLQLFSNKCSSDPFSFRLVVQVFKANICNLCTKCNHNGFFILLRREVLEKHIYKPLYAIIHSYS